MHKISLIITAKNESKSISRLLESIAKQTRRADEVVITVAGELEESDQSAGWQAEMTGTVLKMITLHSTANRAVGRNTAIEASKYEHILITDAGCRLKDTWVEEMEKGFAEADVVAGFYAGEYKNIFEKCELPYVLVMPDRINSNSFLPATRSMGITKTAWKKAGKFNEDYRYAEDYEFARRIQKQGISIKVVPNAVVYWRPRQNLHSFARMIYEHAYGDGYSRTFRPKVMSIYLRYLFFIAVGLLYGPWIMAPLVLYTWYSIQKNYYYVRDFRAIAILPLLQITSDLAVMKGTLFGWVSRSR